MKTYFKQIDWSDDVARAAQQLVRLAIAEDLAGQCDWTTACLVPPQAAGRVAVVARKAGVVAGLPIIGLVFDELDSRARISLTASDGDHVEPGQTLAVLEGPARDLLTGERTLLNFVGRLSGIATITREYVEAVRDTAAQILDTRKTTPGWRLLEKYAVRCGGGWNHRLGLNRAVMIKDNHVALAAQEGLTLPLAIERVRRALGEQQAQVEAIEVEVDTLAQLEAVLPSRPDIVLLDNMTLADLAAAVALRNAVAPDVVLEASGGINLDTVGNIAQTGVDCISVGALTHSAASLDIGLDWQ